MSRSKAKQKFTLEDFREQTEGVECRKDQGVLDEIPKAYKDIDKVMAMQQDLVEIVAERRQVLCVRGELGRTEAMLGSPPVWRLAVLHLAMTSGRGRPAHNRCGEDSSSSIATVGTWCNGSTSTPSTPPRPSGVWRLASGIWPLAPDGPNVDGYRLLSGRYGVRIPVVSTISIYRGVSVAKMRLHLST